jgi:hypothetical protein
MELKNNTNIKTEKGAIMATPLLIVMLATIVEHTALIFCAKCRGSNLVM